MNLVFMRDPLHCFMMMNSWRIINENASFELQFCDLMNVFSLTKFCSFLWSEKPHICRVLLVRLLYSSRRVFTLYLLLFYDSWLYDDELLKNKYYNDNATTRRLNMIQFCGWLMMLSSGKCYSFSAIQPHNEKLEECL